MREGRGNSGVGLLVETNGGVLQDYGSITKPYSDPLMHRSIVADATADNEDYYYRYGSTSKADPYSNYPTAVSGESSPFKMSPWHHSAAGARYSPYESCLWSHHDEGSGADCATAAVPLTALVGSMVRLEGQIYSLAASGELLYTGSDSKNIRVWKNQKDYAGFKSSSGLVKAIIIAGGRIYTGHQDGKIRLWKVSAKNTTLYKRIGTLPRLKDFIRSSLNPANYVEVRRHRSALWIRHVDAISCLALSEDQRLLYSGSWDKTFKIWRVADSRCLESVVAHDDAVNALVAAFGGLVFTGSADGTIKIWRRTLQLKVTKHSLVQTLLKRDCAVTSLAVSPTASFLYCGSSDGLVNFWEGDRNFTHGGVLRNHKMAVLCLVAAGNLLMSGSADKSICVWRRDGGVHTCLSVLSGHTGPVKCLALETEVGAGEDDGRRGRGDATAGRWILYSGSLDKSVKVWRIYEQASEALVKGRQHMPAGLEEYQTYGGLPLIC